MAFALILWMLWPGAPSVAIAPPVASAADVDFQGIDEFLRAEMSRLNIVGLAATIVKDTRTVWARGYGWADVEQQLPVGPDTLFMQASVSKVVTGAALMKLHGEGRFLLDDDINRYLPFKVVNPFYPQAPISFRMLLTHTSSIADNHSLLVKLNAPGDSAMTLHDLLSGFLTPGGPYYDRANFLERRPGEEYLYSNFGYALIGYLVEVIAKQPFDRYCREALFKPLEMDETGWFLAGLNPRHIAIQYASEDASSAGRMRPVEPYGWPGYPDGQLRSSARQMANFLVMLLNDGRYKGVQVLERDAVERIFTKQGLQREDLKRQALLPPVDIGLTWNFQKLDSREVALHTGKGSGLNTCVLLKRNARLGIVLLATGELRNREGFVLLLRRLMAEAERF